MNHLDDTKRVFTQIFLKMVIHNLFFLSNDSWKYVFPEDNAVQSRVT